MLLAWCDNGGDGVEEGERVEGYLFRHALSLSVPGRPSKLHAIGSEDAPPPLPPSPLPLHASDLNRFYLLNRTSTLRVYGVCTPHPLHFFFFFSSPRDRPRCKLANQQATIQAGCAGLVNPAYYRVVRVSTANATAAISKLVDNNPTGWYLFTCIFLPLSCSYN